MMKNRGDTEGKEEPATVIGVEGRSVADSPQVRGRSGVTTNQGGAGRTREPGGAVSPRVFGGAKGVRSQDGANRSRDQRPEAEPQDPLSLTLLMATRPAAQHHSRASLDTAQGC